tara:strand:+ start:891 stop:1442 length:552 start_codon:yes stop_codon:yes gene_type:complete
MGMSKCNVPTLATSILKQDEFIRITETDICILHIINNMDPDEVHKAVFDKLWNPSTYWEEREYAEWKEMTVNQLKALLKENNLPVSGNKKQLIERLYDNENLVKWGKSRPDVVWIPKTEQARRRAKDQAELDARFVISDNSYMYNSEVDGFDALVGFFLTAAIFGLTFLILWSIVWIAEFLLY